VREEIASAWSANAHLDRHITLLEKWFEPGLLHEGTARAFAEDMALALEGAALAKTAPDFVFDGFCAARLDADNRSLAYGATTARIDAKAIVDRASVAA
jgi:putative acyl-CoA dehydrogenase